MKRLLLALAVLAAATVPALADPPGPGGPPGGPCEKGAPPWFCNGHGVDDQITVTTEPPGPNCEAGGLKVVIDRREKPKPEPKQIEPGAVPQGEDPGVVTEPEPNGREHPPRPRPEPTTFFVCNGLPGTQGPAGPAGPAGPPGSPGVQGPAGPVVNVPVQPKVCQSSTRIGARLYLPPRLARFGVVRIQIAKVNGPLRLDKNVRTRVNRSGPPGQPFVFVPIRNRNCGPYLITVGRGSVEPVVQIWNITGRFGLKRTTITG